MGDCDCKNGTKTMNNNACALQVKKMVEGRLIGRSSKCNESPGAWDPCVPRDIAVGVNAHTFVPGDPATDVIIEYRNGTNGYIGLLDFIADRAGGFDPATGDFQDRLGSLLVTEILGAQTADESYGTFAGRGSQVADEAGTPLGVIGRLGRGIALSSLSAERAASFGASANYGSILSKFKLPVVAPQQSFSLRIAADPSAPGPLVDTVVEGTLMAVLFDSAAYQAAMQKHG